jgi:hypothetical protein
MIQACLDQEGNFSGTVAGGLAGWISVCVGFVWFGFQIRGPCRGIISPSRPEVNNKLVPSPKKYRHFAWPVVGALRSRILKF